jgi:hypothetical protein
MLTLLLEPLLQQIYLPAIEGFVPEDMMRTMRAFLQFCYLARRHALDTEDLRQMQVALDEFHQFRKVFETTGVRKENDHPPRQHAMMHYPKFIREYGAPNGICTSITESRHITAIKEPWRRSNRFNALGQMLVTNMRLDQLAASQTNFNARGLLGNALKPSGGNKSHPSTL